MIYDESHCNKNKTKVVKKNPARQYHKMLYEKKITKKNYLIKNFQFRHNLLLKFQCNI